VTTKMLHRDELEDLGLPYNSSIIVSDVEIDEHRWYIVRELIFQDESDNLFWKIQYLSDKTEMGDLDCWNDQDEIEAIQVKPEPITAFIWKEV
jgi:hypothetical protein